MGVDTSSKIGSVALLDGIKVIDELISEKAESFSRSLLVMIDRLLSRNKLELGGLSSLAVASGPGSFTGIRIGLSTLQGLVLSTGLPAYGISTLEAMACAAKAGSRKIAPMIDAGHGNVYFALFAGSGSGTKRLFKDDVGDIKTAVKKGTNETFFFGDITRSGVEEISRAEGRTAGRYEENFMDYSIAAGAAISAYMKISEGGNGRSAPLKPNYIRKSAAEERKLKEMEE